MYDADARDSATDAAHANPAFSAVQDSAHDAEDAEGESEAEGSAESTDPPPQKKAKKSNPLKDWDARTLLKDGTSKRMVYFGFDVELTESNRQHFAWCEVGVHVLKPAANGKSATVSEEAGDHFNERCLDKDAGWSEHSTNVHGITEETLKAEGARDHLVVAQAAYDFMAAKVLEAHPDGTGVSVLLTHNGEACDLDTAWHYQRRHKLKLPACIQ